MSDSVTVENIRINTVETSGRSITVKEKTADVVAVGIQGPAGVPPALRVTSIASSSAPAPNAATDDQYQLTALAVNATFAAPSGSPVNGQKLVIRIKDNGTSRTLSWNSAYRVTGTTLPMATTANKTVYIGCVYNGADSKWDVVAIAQEA